MVASGTPAGSFVPVAEVVTAVGLAGEVKLYPLIDWHAPLLDSACLEWEAGGGVAVTRHRPAGACTVVRLAGCDDREAAEALVGRRLGFRRERYLAADFPRPADGLPFRWVGREVRLADGRRVGVVDEVRRHGAQFTLVIPGPAGEILVPALPPILRPDPGLEGPLIIDPPEGLLDVAGD